MILLCFISRSHRGSHRHSCRSCSNNCRSCSSCHHNCHHRLHSHRHSYRIHQMQMLHVVREMRFHRLRRLFPKGQSSPYFSLTLDLTSIEKRRCMTFKVLANLVDDLIQTKCNVEVFLHISHNLGKYLIVSKNEVSLSLEFSYWKLYEIESYCESRDYYPP